MQRVLTSLVLIPMVAAFTGLIGGGKEEKTKPPSTLPKLATGDSGAAKGGGPKTSVKPGTAKIVGRVVFEGDLPKIDSLVAKMMEHADKATCLAGMDFEKVDQTWMISKDRGVA